MKCTFKQKIQYGNQTFLKGETYDISRKDAAALGFIKTAEVKEEKAEAAKEIKKGK